MQLRAFRNSPFARYLAPFFILIFLSGWQGPAGGRQVFWMYGAKTVVALLVFIYFFKGHWHEIEGRFDVRAVFVGLAVLVIWLVSCAFFRVPSTAAYDPAAFDSNAKMILAVAVRLFGSFTVVPLIEELVWRSFLMRFLVKNDFLSVPLGTYTPVSFWIGTLTFALAHPMWQWPAALLTGIIYGFYLVKTKNLAGCILAHAVTNFGLGIYIIITRDWGLWV